MIIYLITNLINGKVYIGQSIKNDKNYLGSGLLVLKAIKKYGKENFKKTILKKCNSIKELNSLEAYFIGSHDSLSPNGYNISFGGIGKGSTSESTRRKMSKSHIGIHRGEKHPLFGKKHTEETKKKIGLASKGRKQSEKTRRKRSNSLMGHVVLEETRIKLREAQVGDKSSWYGRRHKKETIRKMSDIKKGKNNPFYGIRHTEEAKKKMSQSHKEAFVRKKLFQLDHISP